MIHKRDGFTGLWVQENQPRINLEDDLQVSWLGNHQEQQVAMKKKKIKEKGRRKKEIPVVKRHLTIHLGDPPRSQTSHRFEQQLMAKGKLK